MLPRTMVIQVLLLMHDNAPAGHLGMQKTLAKIRSRFYWFGQCKDVESGAGAVQNVHLGNLPWLLGGL